MLVRSWGERRAESLLGEEGEGEGAYRLLLRLTSLSVIVWMVIEVASERTRLEEEEKGR